MQGEFPDSMNVPVRIVLLFAHPRRGVTNLLPASSSVLGAKLTQIGMTSTNPRAHFDHMLAQTGSCPTRHILREVAALQERAPDGAPVDNEVAFRKSL